jgi:PKHD-type hydroxylase
MIPISQFAPPMASHCGLMGAFTSEECDLIREYGDRQTFKDARVGDGNLDSDVRETDIVWIEPKEETAWMYRKLDGIIAKVNYDQFQMELAGWDGFQYSKYKPDGHYNWHTDVVQQPKDGLFRKLSVVLMLTEPDAYEGGDFLLCESGNNETPIRIRLGKGDMLVFYSHVAHKVESVTGGDRFTLVTWAKGPKPR